MLGKLSGDVILLFASYLFWSCWTEHENMFRGHRGQHVRNWGAIALINSRGNYTYWDLALAMTCFLALDFRQTTQTCTQWFVNSYWPQIGRHESVRPLVRSWNPPETFEKWIIRSTIPKNTEWKNEKHVFWFIDTTGRVLAGSASKQAMHQIWNMSWPMTSN